MPEGSLWEPELWETLQRGRGIEEDVFYQNFQGTEMLPVQPVLEMSLWINCRWSSEALLPGLPLVATSVWRDTSDSPRVSKLWPGAHVGGQ